MLSFTLINKQVVSMKHYLTHLIFIALFLATTSSFAALNKAPALLLPSLEGEFDISKLDGKVIYLDFWASWCDPCRESFPCIADHKEKHGSHGLEIVAVNLDKD